MLFFLLPERRGGLIKERGLIRERDGSLERERERGLKNKTLNVNVDFGAYKKDH